MPTDPDWFIWAIVAGRGWGKTRTAVENISRMLRGPSPLKAPEGAPEIMSIIADSPFDLRQYSIEGPSGFLNVGPKDCRPTHEPSKKTLTWPNGAKALLFSAEDPESTRGASGSFFWWDELAKSRYAKEGWDNMLFGMREGTPRGIVTTTPRPIPLLRDILKSPSTRMTGGSTMENRDNLSPVFFREVIAPKMGTRIGRQEIEAQILDDVPGALWTYGMFKPARIRDFVRIVVAIDPSGASSEDDEQADEIGIIVAGKTHQDTFHLLCDLSCRMSPLGWARRAVIDGYHRFKADRVVAERNFGGGMVESTIRRVDANVPITMLTASRGKVVRAEPIAALYEQGRVTHEPGMERVEDQMLKMTSTGYMGTGSPDRLDAAVWALTDLSGASPTKTGVTTARGMH